MKEAKQKGLIHHIGFSFHDTLPVFKEVIDYFSWDTAQIQYNYMDVGVQATGEGLRYAHSRGVAVVVMEPLKGGKLASPPPEALTVMDASANKRTPRACLVQNSFLIDFFKDYYDRLWSLSQLKCSSIS